MTGRFDGKVAIITGASRGIGLAIAQRLVAEGAKVVITGRTQDTLAEAQQTLGDNSVAITAAGRADDPDHQAETVERTLSEFGRIDYLVNNTGINPVRGPLVDAEADAVRKTLDVNCIAALQWITRVYRAWMHDNGGSIVNVSSIGAVIPHAGLGAYSASKAMLTYLTRHMALELGPQVRVNAVAPAVIKTAFSAVLYEGREAELSEDYPLKRLGVPEDVSSAVAFFLSNDASWVTGQQLVIDGGVSLVGSYR